MSPKVDISDIGVGFVGLTIATRLTHRRRDVFILEKVDVFCQETIRQWAASIGISSSERRAYTACPVF
jgi:glycine/D-amino acid oxidase-like deaminating enzyme